MVCPRKPSFPEKLGTLGTEDWPFAIISLEEKGLSKEVDVTDGEAIQDTIEEHEYPSITNEFHSPRDVSWYGSAIFSPPVATQSVWGKAYKYFPVKIIFLLSIFIFEVGSLTCVLAPNSSAFIAGRAVTGAGCADTFAGCFIIIPLFSKPRLRPALTSSLSATFAITSVVGPLIGGALTQNVTRRWCFYIDLPCGGLAAIAMLFAFQAPKAASSVPASAREKLLQMEIPSAILVCATIVCFTLASRWAGAEKAWRSSGVVGTLVAMPVLLALFAVDQ
ncbi:major facilitator superfamily domain-containing protein [Daldinia sp. FL1419]|nr:major facilitator superfamily domain-containing protein [Daldinia sp. FL1419]